MSEWMRLVCTYIYRLNWANRDTLGYWDQSGDRDDSKLVSCQSVAEHATSQSRRPLTVDLLNIFTWNLNTTTGDQPTIFGLTGGNCETNTPGPIGIWTRTMCSVMHQLVSAYLFLQKCLSCKAGCIHSFILVEGAFGSLLVMDTDAVDTNLRRESRLLVTAFTNCKHKGATQRCFNVVPTSTTLAKRWNSAGQRIALSE